ncbi:unnamed protein product [Rhizophagus irregularis]|nr:unnamed protein product [Rhizophagus irregularis]
MTINRLLELFTSHPILIRILYDRSLPIIIRTLYDRSPSNNNSNSFHPILIQTLYVRSPSHTIRNIPLNTHETIRSPIQYY